MDNQSRASTNSAPQSSQGSPAAHIPSNRISTGSSSMAALPSAWIDRIFGRLHSMYGAKLADQWAGADMESVRQDWAEMLADFTADEIKRGLSACMRRPLAQAPFPPTMPEFAAMCRPPIEFESAYIQAVEQMHNRERFDEHGKSCDKWTHPAIYWAAVKFGPYEMRNTPYRHAAVRWAAILNDTMADTSLPAIPQVLAPSRALPHKLTEQEMARNRERAAGIAAQLAGSMVQRDTESGGGVNPHWQKVAKNFKNYPVGAQQAAIEAHVYRGADVPEPLLSHARGCHLNRYLPAHQRAKADE